VVIETPGKNIPSEVIGFSGPYALLMPFAPLEGVRRGCRALVTSVAGAVRPSAGWLGRVVNGLGEPFDGKGPLLYGPSPYAFRNAPPLAHARRRVGGAARSRCARAQYLHHLLPRPAYGDFLRLRRR
jgi:flagellum-specific ATP synthase